MPKKCKPGYVLCVDIGNTDIACAVYDKGIMHGEFRFKADKSLSSEKYHQYFRGMLSSLSVDELCFVALGSVVPFLSTLIKEALITFGDFPIYEIDGLSDLGLNYLIESREAVGADLVANAFAAFNTYKQSCIIADLGTSTTLQLIGANGDYVGVFIALGLGSAKEALVSRAARLQDLKLSQTDKILGQNTTQAMLSGLVSGHLEMIKGSVERIEKEYPQYAPFKLILTGGWAELLLESLGSSYQFLPHLTLDGLYLAAKHLRGE